jgi:hypothetical protein
MTSTLTVTQVLRDNLSLGNDARRWTPHDLTAVQKVEGLWLCGSPLEPIRRHEHSEFKSLATGEEL